MSLKKLNNESGIILMIVIAFIILMSIILVGIYTRSFSIIVSEVNRAKSIQADLLARSAYWIAYSQLHSNGGTTMPSDFVQTINNIPYSVTFVRDALAGPDEIRVTVSYP